MVAEIGEIRAAVGSCVRVVRWSSSDKRRLLRDYMLSVLHQRITLMSSAVLNFGPNWKELG